MRQSRVAFAVLGHLLMVFQVVGRVVCSTDLCNAEFFEDTPSRKIILLYDFIAVGIDIRRNIAVNRPVIVKIPPHFQVRPVVYRIADAILYCGAPVIEFALI